MLNWLFGARTLADHVRAGDFAAALAVLDDALTAQPGDPELLERRAQMLGRLGRSDEAGDVLVALARRFADRGSACAPMRCSSRRNCWLYPQSEPTAS